MQINLQYYTYPFSCEVCPFFSCLVIINKIAELMIFFSAQTTCRFFYQIHRSCPHALKYFMQTGLLIFLRLRCRFTKHFTSVKKEVILGKVLKRYMPLFFFFKIKMYLIQQDFYLLLSNPFNCFLESQVPLTLT